MNAGKFITKLNLALTATALVGALFAGTAAAKADVERISSVGKPTAESRSADAGGIDGPVGSLRAAGEARTERTAELRARLVEGQVGHLFQAE